MHHLLLRIPGQALDATAARALLQAAGLRAGHFDLHHAVDHAETYVLAESEDPPATAAPLAAGVQRVLLRRRLDVAGASADLEPDHFYAVETDILPASEDDFNAWYEEEHLPGLAAVPGTQRAQRFVAEDSPRYVAVYALAGRDTFGSPAWLAVRGTAWSDRVRPNFRHTKRTMFRTIARRQPVDAPSPTR